MGHQTRRDFLKKSSGFATGVLFSNLVSGCSGLETVRVSGHLWIYASKYPPDWDCTPILDQVFSDFRYAGMEGVEMMEVNLLHEDVVSKVGALIEKYKLPVSGTSYGADMWDQKEHQKILEESKQRWCMDRSGW